MTGTLRISNELLLFQRDTVNMALEWLVREYNCSIDDVREELKDTVYIITGREIPEGNISLLVEKVVEGVVSIKII